MNFIISERKRIVPKCLGNAKRPKAQQIVVEFDYPTLAIKEKLSSGNDMKAITNPQGVMTHMEIDIKTNENDMLKALNLSIENCSYSADKDSHPTEIRDFKSLISAPGFFAPLKAEIYSEIQKAFEDIDEKNSELPTE